MENDVRATLVKTAVASTDSEQTFVLDFAAIDANALTLVGGKAANLGVLTRAGLPVPQGVCVTTEAYRRVAASAGLDDVLDAFHRTSPTDASRLRKLAAAVPDQIAQTVLAGYSSLGANVPVAVRSSATAEDLPFASFAGQQDT